MTNQDNYNQNQPHQFNQNNPANLQNQPIYQMKEVESVIQLDERPEQPREIEQKSKFNEYKYEASPVKNPPPQQPLPPQVHQNNRRMMNNPTIIRRTVNNQTAEIPENNYFSNGPRNNFQGLPNEKIQENQNTFAPVPIQNNMQERISKQEPYSNRNVSRTTPQGRVTLPSRYEAQMQPNREQVQFQNRQNNHEQGQYQQRNNNQDQRFYQNKPNNNQDIANLDEFQPEVFNPQNNNFQENQKQVVQTENKELIEMNQDISNISLPNVKSNITLYKNPEENEKPKKTAKLVKKEFVFKYNSDKNGFFYFLGTAAGRREYVNPFELGQIKVFFSSLAQGDYSNFVGRALTNCRTCNEENAFMGVDLGKDR